MAALQKMPLAHTGRSQRVVFEGATAVGAASEGGGDTDVALRCALMTLQLPVVTVADKVLQLEELL